MRSELGSFSTKMGCRHHVRSTPISDRTADISDWQLRAISRRFPLGWNENRQPTLQQLRLHAGAVDRFVFLSYVSGRLMDAGI
jgi:hypothetical protein